MSLPTWVLEKFQSLDVLEIFPFVQLSAFQQVASPKSISLDIAGRTRRSPKNRYLEPSETESDSSLVAFSIYLVQHW